MKNLLFYTSLFTLCTALNISLNAHAGQVEPLDGPAMQRNVYTASCKYTAPLRTRDRCDEYSSIGRIAADCAMEEAIDNCEADLNADCAEVSVQVTAKASVDFIGYRKCVGKARVHGYSVRY